MAGTPPRAPLFSKLRNGECLLCSTKGDEAFVLYLNAEGSFSVFMTKIKMFPSDAKVGMWFRVKYFVTRSGQNVTVLEASKTEDVVPTRSSAGWAQILLRITAIEDHFVCPYGSMNYVKDSHMREKIRGAIHGMMAWCTLDVAHMRAFNVVELQEVLAPSAELNVLTLNEEDKSAMEIGVVGRVTVTSIGFIMLKPNTNYYFYQMKKEEFPDAIDRGSLGRWYRLWLATGDNRENKRYVRSEETSEIRPTRVIGHRVQIAAKITVHQITGFLACEFGRMVMPNQELIHQIRTYQNSRYWCVFNTTGSDYRLRVLEPEVPIATQQEVAAVSGKTVPNTDSLTPTTAAGDQHKFSAKKVAEALCMWLKGDEAIMLIIAGKARLVRYATKRKSYENGATAGAWYHIEYCTFSTSDQQAHVSKARMLNSNIIPTRLLNGTFCICSALFTTSVKGKLVCEYGLISSITDNDRQIVEAGGESSFGWIYPDNQMNYVVAALCDKDDERGFQTGRTTVKTSSACVALPSAPSPLPNARLSAGVVCAMHEGIIFIYSSAFTFEVIFYGGKDVPNGSLIIGDWVEFTAEQGSSDFLPDNQRITYIRPLVNEPYRTMACYGTVYVECEVDVPSNFGGGTNPLSSAFSRLVRDDRNLINERFYGTTLLAVLVYAFRPGEPCGFWRLETIRRVLRRY